MSNVSFVILIYLAGERLLVVASKRIGTILTDKEDKDDIQIVNKRKL